MLLALLGNRDNSLSKNLVIAGFNNVNRATKDIGEAVNSDVSIFSLTSQSRSDDCLHLD